MTRAAPAVDDLDRLGGRLPLLHRDELDVEQRVLHGQLEEVVGPEAEHDGFLAQLDDGRLIGPFNAMLRAPALARGFGALTGAVGGAGLSPVVRQAVILTVAGAWGADYEIYAHRSAAIVAGLTDDEIDDVLAGRDPRTLDAEAAVGREVAEQVVRHRTVPPDVYGRAINTFGEAGTMALLGLVAQYQLVSSILVTFDVPAPPVDPEVGTRE